MNEKITLARLKQLKQQGQPITILTCYDYSFAVMLQEAGIDSLLVGDSLSQTVLGYPTTLHADMDLMITLTAAVRRGAPRVYLIGDMPFLSYTVSTEQALINAGRFMTQANCDVVKLEVDGRHADIVYQLSRAGIPVMAHLGYRPQAAQTEDRIVQTRQVEKAKQLVEDARAMLQAGAISLLLECVTEVTAAVVTHLTDLPVISCGSGPACDGQVLVLHEMMGLPGANNPRFVRQFGNLRQPVQQAASDYAAAVRQKTFPTSEHTYNMKPEQQREFLDWAAQFLKQ